MCGIAGLFSENIFPYKRKELVRQMLISMVHRGPDHFDMLDMDSLCFGSQRLSIVDIQGSTQPIYNEDKSVCLVFNGEIYNYLCLRKKLQECGHNFRTRGDGEVIIHAYEEWGNLSLQKINGMFAFALWDESNKILLIARDRLGEKPLYYSLRNNCFLFASELNAILCGLSEIPQINYTALVKYLQLSYIPSPESPFTEIKKLLPGHYLTWNGNELKIKPYWSPKFIPKEIIREEEANYYILKYLRDSIKYRFSAEVPVGIFLSGGLDSSLIVALSRKQTDGPLNTFSVRFPGSKEFNEESYSNLVASTYNCNHHSICLKSPSIFDVNKVYGYYGEPFGDTAAIPTFCLAKYAKDYVRIVLTGDGGDELFAGYSRYLSVINALNPLETNKEIKSIFDSSEIIRVAKKQLNCLNYYDEIVSRKFVGENKKTPDILDVLINIDLKTYLPDCLLFKIDIATMANSIEARSPYLDYKLVDFILSLPTSYKINDKQTKYILRQAAKKYLPENIITRKKQGFSVPLNQWIQSLKSDLFDILLDRSLSDYGFFNQNEIERMLKEHFAHKSNYSKKLWLILLLKLWFDRLEKFE